MKPTRLQLAEHASIVYYHVPEFGVALDDLLAPSYWTHVAKDLRPGNRIEVLSPIGDWWAMLIVRNVTRIEAAVSVLDHVQLEEAPAAATPDQPYRIQWRGPSAKWGIVRNADGGVVTDGMASREMAEQWLKNHEKAMAA